MATKTTNKVTKATAKAIPARRTTARYVDGFVLPIPKRKLAAYRTISRKMGKICKEYGALEYKECVADDMKNSVGITFTKLAKLKAGEVVVFSWISYKSRAHRDSINKKITKDPRVAKICDMNNMPFDCKRMACGGFKIFVDLN